jgi:cyclic pyranopterin phosphate synthase
MIARRPGLPLLSPSPVERRQPSDRPDPPALPGLPVLPVLPVLIDGHARRISYLRISLTDRCNYRCTYCMPESGVDVVPKGDVLSLEELERVVAAMCQIGVRRVRLTGGEPTVRNGLVDLVGRLSRLPLEDLAMTTNGHVLREVARPLRAAGLRRLNVSLDSLRPERFRAVTRWGDLARVQEGIEVAQAAGFQGTKLNAVALAGFNDDELDQLCRWSWERDIVPRFIEWMPMSDGALFAPGSFLPAAAIRERLVAAFGPIAPLGPDDAAGLPGVGPARYGRVEGGPFAGRRFGIISAVTEQFCDTCNRVRLSAVGRLQSCLARDEEVDLKAPLRAGASVEELVSIVRDGAAAKAHGHEFSATGCGGPRKHMVSIGG